MPAADETLPRLLYTADQVRELDRIAIEDNGVPGIVLMKRAGRAAFALLQRRWPREPLTVFCGTGNNGGDGFVIAALAAEQHIPVRLWQVGDPEKIRGDAATAREYAAAAGVMIHLWQGQSPERGVVVDALLGTGFSGRLRDHYRAAIAVINDSALPVLGVDVPSGLNADTGFVEDAAIRAAATISFIGLKRGLFTGHGPDHAGPVHFDDLSVPPALGEYPQAAVHRFAHRDVAKSLLPRRAGAHKGHSGHVLVAGGNHGFAGAALLAASAAARCGAGLISCATRPEHVAGILAARPEVMVAGVTGDRGLSPETCASATVIAVGPGLGQDDWGAEMLRSVAARGVPMVVDADALNLVAAGALGEQPNRDRWVLTPHPGEAARLLGVSNSEVNRDRFAAVSALQHRYGGVVVLKGAGTLICDGGPVIWLADYAQPALASGGTGDVLTGIIAALIAQGVPLIGAAKLGVALHAEAGGVAARAGVRGTLASDVVDALRGLVN